MFAEHWEHNKSKLTMTMLDMFDPDDDANIIATYLFRKLRSSHGMPCRDIVCGNVYTVIV